MGSISSYIAQGSGIEDPLEMIEHFDEKEIAILDSTFDGLDNCEILDVHCHVTGMGKPSETGCCVHDKMTSDSILHSYHRMKINIFMQASRVDTNHEEPDIEYVRHLKALVRTWKPFSRWNEYDNDRPKTCLLAFDQVYKSNGDLDRDSTTFYIPNDWVNSICEEDPDLFEMAMSVHPYRNDALDELEKWAMRGVKIVKWLPNSQMIDLEHEKCEAFYDKMAQLDLVLLCHTGEEHSVDTGGVVQDFGNPLKLRKPMDHGVKVIAAHMASEGKGRDYDKEKKAIWGYPKEENFKLLLRLMGEEKYQHLLYADISAILVFRRVPYIKEMLRLQNIHDRLIFGTDYPVPAISAIISTEQLIQEQILEEQYKPLLNKLWKFNPIFFAFATVRLLRDQDGNRFQDCIFQRPDILRSDCEMKNDSDMDEEQKSNQQDQNSDQEDTVQL